MKSLAALWIVGFVGVVLALAFGFEEPPRALFALSAICICVPPLTILAHLLMTKTLSRDEKHFWLRGFFSRKALSVASAYLAKLQGPSA